MLVPSLVYKEQLENEFAKRLYDDDYFYYMGYAHGHELPNLKPEDNHYRWAIVGNSYEDLDYFGGVKIRKIIPDSTLIGYFAYQINPDTDSVCNFGLYSFDKGNPLIGHDVFKHMEQLIFMHHRVEWCCIGGNPALRGYTRFLQRMIEKYDVFGYRHCLHHNTKDNKGRYHDEYIFEIVER